MQFMVQLLTPNTPWRTSSSASNKRTLELLKLKKFSRCWLYKKRAEDLKLPVPVSRTINVVVSTQERFVCIDELYNLFLLRDVVRTNITETRAEERSIDQEIYLEGSLKLQGTTENKINRLKNRT